MKLYGRISTRKADEVLEARGVILLLAICALVIMVAVESLFGSIGVSVLWTIVKGAFYLVAIFVTIKVLQLAWNLVKIMASKI